MKTLHLIDQFYRPGTYDAYTFVFDEQDPHTGYYTMLALSEDGHMFSQWTEGLYAPGDANEHLGRRLALGELDQPLLTAVGGRLAESQRDAEPSGPTSTTPREELA